MCDRVLFSHVAGSTLTRQENPHSPVLKYKNSVLRAKIKLKSGIFRLDLPNFFRHQGQSSK